MRNDYGDPTLGTCKETVEGGNHFRYWVQSGSSANRYYSICHLLCLSTLLISLFPLQSGAVFMAVSYELPEQCEHVATRFPLVCALLTLTPLCHSESRYHFQWVRALPFLAFFCGTKPKFILQRYNLARYDFPDSFLCGLLTNHPNQ